MYLNLSMLKERFGNDPNVRFREEIVNGRSVTIVCYMVADDKLWSQELGVETRGVCFDTATGALLSLPFEKFFNLNEKVATQYHTVRAQMSHETNYVCEKVDGSMITPALIDGEVHLKTKKSFSSDVAKLAQAAAPRNVIEMCRWALQHRLTPIFEFSSPDSKIVIDYGAAPKFKLLAIRDMFTGRYLDMSVVEYHANNFGIESAKYYESHDLEHLVEDSANAEGIEGWVIYVGDQQRVKIKTKWYLDRHRMLDIRERDVARFVLEDVLDDLIPSMIEGEADMDAIRRIESKISSDLSHLRARIDTAAAIAKTYEDGTVRAKWINENHRDISPFVFQQSRDQEVSDSALKNWYMKHHLKDFNLISVGNPNFSRVAVESEDES